VPAVLECGGCGRPTIPTADGDCPFCGERVAGRRARLSRAEVAACYDLHRRGRSVWSIATAIWERKGYRSARSAYCSLRGFFEREEIARGLRPPKPRRRHGVARKLGEAELRAAHRRYRVEGLSVNALAKELWRGAGYRSWRACASALYGGFRDLGLPLRERIAAVRMASTVHGLAPKHGPRPGYGAYKRRVLRREADRPACAGHRTQPPRKGERCRRPARAGSRYCAAHDPELAPGRRAHLDRVHAGRRDALAASALPMAPFAAYVASRLAEEGSLRRAGGALGLGATSVSHYARGLGSDKRAKATIQRVTVERVLERDGRAIGELYPELVAAEDRDRGGGPR
jgi:hypothetical protein